MGGITQVLKSGDLVSGYPAYFCRAWVDFNGTGTIGIRQSGGVTSLTDNGVGDYTVNFINAAPFGSYGVFAQCAALVGTDNVQASPRVGGLTTGGVRIDCHNWATPWLAQDSSELFVGVFY